MEVRGYLYAPASLPQGNRSHYPFDGKLGGPQSSIGIVKKEIYPLPVMGPSSLLLSLNRLAIPSPLVYEILNTNRCLLQFPEMFFNFIWFM
jgi:hypothetical protein